MRVKLVKKKKDRGQIYFTQRPEIHPLKLLRLFKSLTKSLERFPFLERTFVVEEAVNAHQDRIQWTRLYNTWCHFSISNSCITTVKCNEFRFLRLRSQYFSGYDLNIKSCKKIIYNTCFTHRSGLFQDSLWVDLKYYCNRSVYKTR